MHDNGFKNGGSALKRGDDGRFVPGTAGGPGRPPGFCNAATTDARTLKAIACEHALEPVESNGATVTRLEAALDDLFERTKPGYVQLMQKLMPRESTGADPGDGWVDPELED